MHHQHREIILVLIHESRVTNVNGIFFFFFFLLCGCGSGEIVHSCLGDAKVDLGNEERESEALNRV